IGICALYNGSYHRASAQIQPRRAIKFITGYPLPSMIYEISQNKFNNKKEFSTILKKNLKHFSEGSKEIIIYDISGKRINKFKNNKLSTGIYFIKTEKETYKTIIIK
ncbi:MAG: hypothetical protein RMJ34_04000, partial [candidate division WOR-3 bacterium]|nr:hypothetical protein [candidate division WOR-3 bacterium]